jgi:hypothetical protein
MRPLKNGYGVREPICTIRGANSAVSIVLAQKKIVKEIDRLRSAKAHPTQQPAVPMLECPSLSALRPVRLQ